MVEDKWDTTPSHTGYRRIEQITEKNKGKNDNSEGSGEDSSSSSSSKKKSDSSSSSKKKNKAKVNKSKSYIESPLTVPTYRYGMPNEYSIGRAGLEVYQTDEEHYVPYIPTGSVSGEGTTTVEDDSIDTESEEDETPGFNLHMGEIVTTYYEPYLESISFESDYKDMNSSGTVKLDTINPKRSYKGVRVNLLADWDDDEDDGYKWEYLQPALEGFITEQTFNENDVEIAVSGWSKALEIKYKFNFKQMYRSEIINQVILTAGLKPVLNFQGLDDDITNFKNYSESSGSSNEDTSVNVKSTGSKSLDKAINNAVRGITEPLAKAKALDKAFKSHCVYEKYSDCHHSSLESAWKDGSLNCADGANVLCAMFLAVGLNAVIVHLPAEVTQGYGHYIVKVSISGKDYYTDSSGAEGAHNTRPFGQIWPNNGAISSGSTVGTKIS